MELLSFILKDEVEAVGLSKFREKTDQYPSFIDQNFKVHKQYFKPDYSNNFFLFLLVFII